MQAMDKMCYCKVPVLLTTQKLPYLNFGSQENTGRSHEHWVYTFQGIPAHKKR